MSKSDHELLELAAKAIGAAEYSARLWPGLCLSDDPECAPFFVNSRGGGAKGWNPLTDDGDAFRLAVQLNLVYGTLFSRRVADNHSGGGDIYAATRRAIVRAAAEIGRELP